MSLLASISQTSGNWNGYYARIEFHSYNEKYTGAYPNLYFEFDVQAIIIAQNGGTWSISANTTFNYGGVQKTYYINSWYNGGQSQWYYVGHHKKKCSCARSNRFNDSCSVSGFPNVSGSGSITSPTIGLPTITLKEDDIQQTEVTLKWTKSNDGYNIYTLYIEKPDGTKTGQLNGSSGSVTFEGLTQNTSYTYKLHTWLATGSGNSLDHKELTVKTLENYPEITVVNVDYELIDMGDTDNVQFSFVSSDDAHVSKWYFQIKDGQEKSNDLNSYVESGLPKNLESYIDVWTEDTLGRISPTKFRLEFHTTYTQMLVWRKRKTNGYQLLDAFLLNGKQSSGIKSTVNNGEITLNGTSTGAAFLVMPFSKKQGEIINIKANNPTANSAVCLRFADAIGQLTTGDTYLTSVNLSANVTLNKDCVEFIIRVASGTTLTNYKLKPMLYQDGDGTWEEFSDGKPADDWVKGFPLCLNEGEYDYCRIWPYDGSKWLEPMSFVEGDITVGNTFSKETSDNGLKIMYMDGQTEQDGEPSPDNEVPIRNVEITNIMYGTKNLFVLNKETFSGGGLTGSLQPDGSILVNGTPSKQYSQVYSIDVSLPKGSYYISGGAVGFVYAQANIYRGEKRSLYSNTTFVIDDEVTKIQLVIQSGTNLDSINNYVIYPMINIGDTKAEFEPYKGGSTTLANSLILAKDDYYKQGQIIRKRKKAVFDGSGDEDWLDGSINDQSLIRFSIAITDMKINPSGKCNRLEWVIIPNAQSTKEVVGGNVSQSRLNVIIKKSRLETEDISGFKKWLSTHNLVVEYELETPEIESFKMPTLPSYSPYTNAWCDNTIETKIDWHELPEPSTISLTSFAVKTYHELIKEE